MNRYSPVYINESYYHILSIGNLIIRKQNSLGEIFISQ